MNGNANYDCLNLIICNDPGKMMIVGRKFWEMYLLGVCQEVTLGLDIGPWHTIMTRIHIRIVNVRLDR